MNNQTMKRIKESLVSSNTLDALGSDSCTVSTLSVRGPNSKDESDLLNAVNFKDDSEFLAEASFAGDADENIMDPCAVCFTDRNFPKKATHFCDDCGLLGHFLCEQCLGFHKKFTNHKSVKSFAAAKYKRGSSTKKSTQRKKQLDVDSGDKKRTESRQETEIAFNEMKKENDNLKKDIKILQDDNANLKRIVSEANEKVITLQNKISHINSEAENKLTLKGQQVEQNANDNANKRSNHEKVLQQKAAGIDSLQENVDKLSRKRKEFEEIEKQLHNANKSVEDRENTIQEMIKDKRIIESEKSKLENECENIREQLRIREEQIKGMNKNSSNSDQSPKSQQADEIKQKLKEINDLKNDLTDAERTNNNLKVEKDTLDKKLRQSADQVKAKEHEINALKEEHEKMIKRKEEKLRQSADQVKAKEHDINTLKEEHEKKIKSKEEKLRQLTNQVTTKEDEIKTLKEEHVKQLKAKDDTIQKLQTEKKVDQRKNSGKRNEGSNSLEEKLRSAQGEIDELKNRLSKVVGANIMNDNPNITDLSAENRPTKLSEKFSELYDNEWTDAYEEAENEFKNEEKGIAHLYNTLLDVFDFCKRKSEEHAKHIRDSVTTLPNAPKMRPKSAAIGVTNQRQLKEVRKSFAPMLIERVFQNYINEKKLNFTKKENTWKFIKKCVEICWLMNSQDPPVILDTSVVDGTFFDVDKFRTFTKTGKLVDYVVWPPMLLHKGGPMLCKGVAQGK